MGNDLTTTFKRVILFSVLAALLGVGIVYGLRYELKPANSTQTLPTTVSVEGVGDTAGLELTMAVEKTEYSLGEPINITFAVTNIGNQTITVLESSQNFDFYIFNNMNSTFYNNMDNITYFTSIVFSNTTVYWYENAKKIIPLETPAPLSAGESLTETLVWGQTYCTPLVPLNENVAVSPGTYYIVGLGICGRTPPLQVIIHNT
jgi:hypothetical protein